MNDSKTSLYTKIPYQFYPIPKEFLTNEFLEDPIMMKLIVYIFKRIRPFPQLVEIMNNKRIVEVQLQPFEFIFGRVACAKECGVSEEEIRSRVNKLFGQPSRYHVRLNPSSSKAKNLSRENSSQHGDVDTQQFLEKNPSSSTSTFTVYKLMTDNLTKINQQKNPSSCSQKNSPLENDSHDIVEANKKTPAVPPTNKKEQEEEEQKNICLKETRKKRDVHNSQPFVTPLPPKGGVVVPLSFSINENKEQKFSEEDVIALEWKLMQPPISLNSPNLTTIKRWCTRKGLYRTEYSVQMLEREIGKKAKSGKEVSNKEGWIETCLQEEWDLKERAVIRNRLFLENFRETHKITTLKFFQKSAKDYETHYEFEFTRNPEQFEEYVRLKYGIS